MRKELAMATTENANYPVIAGVFRERDKAEQAMAALNQQHIGDEPAEMTVYYPQNEGTVDESQLDPNTRYVVHIHVTAPGRDQDAVGVLVSYGSNNADLPDGTTLVHGSIVRDDEAAAQKTPEQPAPQAASPSFFGDANVPRQPNEISVTEHTDSSST
jgi:hypothetical protein